MGQAIAAKCAERCGWVGWGVTGWRDAKPAEIAMYNRDVMQGEATPRFRWRGALQFRARLRDTRCPRCGSVGLDRAPRLAAVERRA